MQGIGRHVIDLLYSVLKPLHNHALFFIDDISIFIPLDRPSDELIQHISVQLVSQVVSCRVCEACIWALELSLVYHLKRPIFNENGTWLECVNKLLSK